MLDLDAYFARIGYAGPRAVLDAIVHAHTRAIPFENLDVLLGRRVDLALDAIVGKLVHARRGGYCFEQNTLLLAVLDALGFRVRPLSGRVRQGRPRDYTPARTHLMVRVELDHPYLADVGLGSLSPTAALRLDVGDEQPTPHEPRRLLREGGLVYHQARLGDAWQDLCELTLEEMPPIDREVANWYTSTHPGSHFKNRLIVARALADGGRVTLLNRELTVRAAGGHAEVHVLASPDELLDVLAARFGLAFPAGTQFPCPALDWPA